MSEGEVLDGWRIGACGRYFPSNHSDVKAQMNVRIYQAWQL